MNEILLSVIILASAVFLSLVVYAILKFIFKRWNKFAEGKNIKIDFSQLKSALLFLLPAIFVLFVLPFLKFDKDFMDIFAHGVFLWLIASIGFLLIKIVYLARDLIFSHYDISARDNLRARKVYTQLGVISNIITIGIIVITVSVMLMTFGKIRQIGVSLLASAGVMGIVLGFAAQKTLGNLIAGIQIAIAQPMRIDDAVVVENEWGWIEDITLTYVVVRIWDLRRLVLPISYFLDKPFQNWTRTSADIIGSVYIYADYTLPVDAVRKELDNILQNSKFWDKKTKVLQVTNTTDRSIELRALMSAADSPTAWNLRCEVREKLLKFLQEKYPQCLPRTRVELPQRKEAGKNA